MVKKPRYIVDNIDANGDVVRSRAFKTQREVVEAFPETFTVSTVREHLRQKARIRKGEESRLEKYRKNRIRRYLATRGE